MVAFGVWLHISVYVVAATVFCLLHWNLRKAAAVVAAVSLIFGGFGVALQRNKNRPKTARLALNTLAWWALATAIFLCGALDKAWYEPDSHFGAAQGVAWGAFAGLCASDTWYMNDNREKGTWVKLALYVSAQTVYACSALSMFYLGEIRNRIQKGKTLADTLFYPANASTLCFEDAVDPAHTVPVARLWPGVSSHTHCAWVYWEALRGNALYVILFVCFLRIVANDARNTRLLSRVVLLVSQLFAFVGYSGIVDKLAKEDLWQVNVGSITCLLIHYILSILGTLWQSSSTQISPNATHIEMTNRNYVYTYLSQDALRQRKLSNNADAC